MKIKEVCKTTGLTDKAIRFYISNELINPKYTENYAGRKNYEFSDDDINALKTIALLRYYDFSVSQIKEMITRQNKTTEILEEHIDEMKVTNNQSSLILNALQNASMSKITNIEDLSAALEENLYSKQQSTANNDIDYKKIIKTYSKKVKKKLPKLIVFIILGVLTGTTLITGIIIILVKFLLSVEGIWE